MSATVESSRRCCHADEEAAACITPHTPPPGPVKRFPHHIDSHLQSTGACCTSASQLSSIVAESSVNSDITNSSRSNSKSEVVVTDPVKGGGIAAAYTPDRCIGDESNGLTPASGASFPNITAATPSSFTVDQDPLDYLLLVFTPPVMPMPLHGQEMSIIATTATDATPVVKGSYRPAARALFSSTDPHESGNCTFSSSTGGKSGAVARPSASTAAALSGRSASEDVERLIQLFSGLCMTEGSGSEAA